MQERLRLRSSEWLLTGSLLLLLASLLMIAKIKAFQTGGPLKEKIVTLEVTIQGHVKNPGVYAARRGASLGEVLKDAQPKKFADLRALCLKEPISQSLELTIQPLQELIIQVEGAVQNPGPIAIAPGTKVSDLKKILPLNKEADLTFFKKKRLLQDGETVKVPSRKS